MKALSIKQPWASLIAHGIKDIENRTWRTHFRGRIYIHASQTPQSGLYKEFIPSWMELSEDQRRMVVYASQFRGGIIGEVDIVDCVINHSSIWAEKGIDKPIWNLVLANPVLYNKPILNVKGKLSFWEYSVD